MACFRHGVFSWLELAGLGLGTARVPTVRSRHTFTLHRIQEWTPNCKITDNKKHTTTKLRHGRQ